jgi:tRNA (cmo5U34)-methyltransferase
LTQQAFTPDPNPATAQAGRLFSGPIGTEYHMLDLICPAAAAMSERVGGFVAGFSADGRRRGGSLNVFEIGCGTGATTLAMLRSREDLLILAADNEPAMLNQARGNLSIFVDQGRVRFIEADALSAVVKGELVIKLSCPSFCPSNLTARRLPSDTGS